MRVSLLRYFLSLLLAIALTAQAQASVASSCHAKGQYLSHANISSHLSLGQASLGQAEMHSKHSHGIDASDFHPTAPDHSETPSAFAKAKCSYCANTCSIVYLPATVAVSLSPGLESSDTFVALVKQYKDALLDGLLRPPRP